MMRRRISYLFSLVLCITLDPVHALSTATPSSSSSSPLANRKQQSSASASRQAPPTAKQPKIVQAVTFKTKKTLHFSKESRRPDRRRQHREDTHQWLKSVDKELESTAVGNLTQSTLSQLFPVITCWARKRSSEGAQKAQHYYDRYIAEYKAGNLRARPQVRLFNACIDGWTKSRRRDAPIRIQRIIREMQALKNESPELLGTLNPDVITMSSFCLAWAKSRRPEAPKQANMILQYMEKNSLKPNTLTYNAVLLAHVHSTRRDKALTCEAIIDRMVRRYEEQGHAECRPDVCTYQSLIAAWSRTSMAGTPQKAEEVLNWMFRESHTSPHLEPNGHCYVAAIHAWSHSEEIHKSRRAYEILQHQRLGYQDSGGKDTLRPNVVAYTAVLNACAMPVGDAEESEAALSIAQLVLEEMRVYKHDVPNFLTYSAFLHVIGSTLPYGDPRKEFLARKTFRQAREDGQVGYLVLEKLHTASPATYHDICANLTSPEGVVTIPFWWGRNVVGERDPGGVLKDDCSQQIAKPNYIRLQQVKRKHGKTSKYKVRETKSRRKSKTTADKPEDFDIHWSFDPLSKS